MGTLDGTAYAKALKTIYAEGFEVVWYPESPFVAWITKSYDFEGDGRFVNPLYEGPQGGSSVAVALNAQSTLQHDRFLVTRKKEYVIASIDNETLRASRSKKGAIGAALKTSVDAAMYSFGQQVGTLAWGDGSGTRGTVGAYAGGVITLKQIRDVANFAKGMRLVTKTAGVLNAGTALITAINREAGKLTVTLEGGMADPVANDTIARNGDYTASAGNVMTGVLGWVPATAPGGGDNFKGVNRSVDINRLAGTRINGGGRPIEEVCIDAQAELSFHGGRADTLWMNSVRFAELLKSMHSKAWIQLQSSGGKVAVSFTGISLAGERGPVAVMADPKCPYSYGLMTRREAWELACLDDIPHWSDEDGNKFRVEQSADGIQFRLKAYGDFICNRPVDCALINFDA